MMPWRLRWLLGEVFDLSNIAKHARVLHSSWKYWVALLLKLTPGLWPFTIQLRLRQGGVIAVKEFMTLFIYKEIFVDGCYDLPLPRHPEPMIVDVGANTGLFILRMKQLYPKSTVLGYEPFPGNYLQLKRCLGVCGLEGVDVLMQGVGGVQRTAKLYVHPRNVGGHSIYRSSAGSDRFVDIELVGIQDVLRSIGGRNCNLLKLDCEGAEREIILGIDEQAALRIERILFEPTAGLYDIRKLAVHLESIGYRVGNWRGLCLAQRPAESGRKLAS